MLREQMESLCENVKMTLVTPGQGYKRPVVDQSLWYTGGTQQVTQCPLAKRCNIFWLDS